jgi:hypothetical protein
LVIPVPRPVELPHPGGIDIVRKCKTRPQAKQGTKGEGDFGRDFGKAGHLVFLPLVITNIVEKRRKKARKTT